MITRSPALVALFLLGSVASLPGCQSTPDYKIFVHDVPMNASLLMVGFKSDSDTVGKTSWVVPVSQLGSDERQLFTISINLDTFPDASGVVSLGTIDASGCLTSVTSTSAGTRSGGGGVSDVDIELDPNLAPNPLRVATASQNLSPCAKVPGLSMPWPTSPWAIPTPLMVINVIREVRGPVGGPTVTIHFYGWGFDRGRIEAVFALVPPNNQPPACVAMVTMLLGPNFPPPLQYGKDPGFKLISPAQIDLGVSNPMLLMMLGSGMTGYLAISCIDSSPFTYTVKNQAYLKDPRTPGGLVTFTEQIPK